jgi:hypothetical protein
MGRPARPLYDTANHDRLSDDPIVGLPATVIYRSGPHRSRAGEAMVANAASHLNAIREEFDYFLGANKISVLLASLASFAITPPYRSLRSNTGRHFAPFADAQSNPFVIIRSPAELGAKATPFAFLRAAEGLFKMRILERRSDMGRAKPLSTSRAPFSEARATTRRRRHEYGVRVEYAPNWLDRPRQNGTPRLRATDIHGNQHCLSERLAESCRCDVRDWGAVHSISRSAKTPSLLPYCSTNPTRSSTARMRLHPRSTRSWTLTSLARFPGGIIARCQSPPS